MKLKKGSIFEPKSRKTGPVKYLCICAHPSDTEMMAIHGVQKGYRAKKYSFSTVVCSNASIDDASIGLVRSNEQKRAAEIGRYNSVYFLKYKIPEIKDPENEDILDDFVQIIKELKPSIIYTHSLLDKDPVHVSVAVKVINALRKLKRSEHPRVLYGCELWRDLDWVNENRLVFLSADKNIKFQKKLLGCFKAENNVRQYLEAAVGRRYSNSVFNNPKKSSKLSSKAINMTTLLRRKDLPIKRFAMSFVDDIYTEINDAMDRAL